MLQGSKAPGVFLSPPDPAVALSLPGSETGRLGLSLVASSWHLPGDAFTEVWLSERD